MNFLDPAQMQDWSNIDTDITLAALARKDTALISHEVFANLNDIEKSWAGAFEHPILPDLALSNLFIVSLNYPSEMRCWLRNKLRLFSDFLERAVRGCLANRQPIYFLKSAGNLLPRRARSPM